MSGQSMPPEPLPAGNNLPAREPEAANPPGAGRAIQPGPGEDATPAGVGGGMAPAGVGAMVPPSPPDTPPDPAAANGPLWPRLVAADGAYTPPRLIRWPIVVGIVLFAVWTATAVAVHAAPTSPPSSAAASSPGSAAGYVLAASDAHFTGTFPTKPQRTTQSLGTITVIVYLAQVPSHAVGITYIQVPASAPFSLNGGINGIAASLPAGKVISRRSLTYRGQPAEDATISSSAGSARIRVVRFGSSAYVLEGVGNTPASFSHDYQVLLDSFRPLPR
jgi:hypothetical protein